MSTQKRLYKEYGLKNEREISGLVMGMDKQIYPNNSELAFTARVETSDSDYLFISPWLRVTDEVKRISGAGGPLGTFGLATLLDTAIREKSEVNFTVCDYKYGLMMTKVRFARGEEYIFWREK